jgi:hypothetical protein
MKGSSHGTLGFGHRDRLSTTMRLASRVASAPPAHNFNSVSALIYIGSNTPYPNGQYVF